LSQPNLSIDSSQKLIIKSTYTSFKLIAGNESCFQTQRKYLKENLRNSDKPFGTYSIILHENYKKVEQTKEIEYVDYKKLLVPRKALRSVLLPGWGSYSVNGGKGSVFGEKFSPWIITAGTFTLLCSGSALLISSNKNYKLYHQATEQEEINRLYKNANSRYQGGNLLIGLGIALWVTDIVWATYKGIKISKVQENITKQRLSIAINPALSNKTFATTIIYNIK